MAILGDPSRSQVGFQHLRRRYIKRAEYLLDDAAFQGAVSSARRRWNVDYPRFAIGEGETPQHRLGSFLDIPERLVAATDAMPRDPRNRSEDDEEASWAASMWPALIRPIPVKFWPENDFPNPFAWSFHELLPHPADRFVSACVCSDVGVSTTLEKLFPPFLAQPAAFDVTPSPANLQAAIRAPVERDVYLRELQERLKDDPTELERIEREATTVSAVAWRDAYAPFSPGSYWPYMPILPGMSSTDVKHVAGIIAEEARSAFHEVSLDDRVVALLDSGKTQDAVARQLGVDVRTVRNTTRRPKRKK